MLLGNVGRAVGRRSLVFLKLQVYISIVMFSHKMSSHAKKGSPATHVIPETFVAAALENLEAVGVVMDRDVDDDAED